MVESRRVSLPFRVSIDKHISHNAVMAVTGDIATLGSWNPHKCLALQRISKNGDGETWGKDIDVVPSQTEISYRYLIAEILDFNDEDDSRLVKVIMWETFRVPRCVSILDILLNDEIAVDTFGTYREETKIQRGWLTGQREVHLRVYDGAFKWFKPRHRGRRLYLRCSQVMLKQDQACEAGNPESGDLSNSQMITEDDETCDSVSMPHLRQIATYSILQAGQSGARLPDLSRNHGAVEIKPGDYVTFHFQTLDLEAISVEFEIYVGTRLSEPSDTSDPRLIGTTRMMPFEQTAGIKWMHIFGNHRRVIGQMKVDFLIINSLHEVVQLMDVSYSKHWMNRGILKIGHRGSGTSYPDCGEPHLKVSTVKENTLRSLRTAFEHGADYVEFDVHLSKDRVPVVYHDFRVVLTLRKKQQQSHRYVQIAVKDLTLDELQVLKVSPSGVLAAGHSNDEMTSEESDALETLAFCTLRQIFDHFGKEDTTAGFNIEVKHPILLKSGEHEQEHYFERNEAVDIILKEVFRSAGKRRIVFSSFDPDVCTMLRLKQNKYPVLFLTQGDTKRYPPYADLRTRTTTASIFHAADMDLLGVCAFSDELIANADVMALAKKKDLVVFVWGSDIDDAAMQQRLKELNVNAIIFDRIHEYHKHGTVNVLRSKSLSLSRTWEASALHTLEGLAEDSDSAGDRSEVLSGDSMEDSSPAAPTTGSSIAASSSIEGDTDGPPSKRQREEV